LRFLVFVVVYAWDIRCIVITEVPFKSNILLYPIEAKMSSHNLAA
jgi:hypothetical protein